MFKKILYFFIPPAPLPSPPRRKHSTIPRADTLGITICNGCSKPQQIGPTVTPSPIAFTRLKAMFAESRFGKITKFATPESVESGIARNEFAPPARRRHAFRRRFPIPDPRPGSTPSAWRILRADGELEPPKLECESSATFGVIPNLTHRLGRPAASSPSVRPRSGPYSHACRRRTARPVCKISAVNA